jgi:hypothetical protein
MFRSTYTMQRGMLSDVHRGGVIVVFPESSAPLLAAVELLPDATGDQLHAGSDLVLTAVQDQQVHVIARYLVIQHAETEPLPRLVELEPAAPTRAGPART